MMFAGPSASGDVPAEPRQSSPREVAEAAPEGERMLPSRYPLTVLPLLEGAAPIGQVSFLSSHGTEK
jgi:hypothetical protein